MKIRCPICGIDGLLQQRGNSYRVQHYQGYENGKRLYLYHKVEVNGSKLLEVKKAKNELISGNVAPPIGFEPMTDWLTASRSTGLSHGGTANHYPLSVQQKYLRIAMCDRATILSA
jgi:hypothetical protein